MMVFQHKFVLNVVKRMEEEKGIKKREQYFTLIDYKKIAYANWEILNEYFSLEEKGGKNKQLEWLDKLKSN